MNQFFYSITTALTVFIRSIISCKHSMHCSSLPMICAIRSVLCGAMFEKIFKRHPTRCKLNTKLSKINWIEDFFALIFYSISYFTLVEYYYEFLSRLKITNSRNEEMGKCNQKWNQEVTSVQSLLPFPLKISLRVEKEREKRIPRKNDKSFFIYIIFHDSCSSFEA